ncbi:CPBP family intramembrane glutamic endopeptidase [Streptococcus massiliensis]|uniref:CAAX amino terminal protease family protein n=1 Tax=Streptococcus massiliensis TaxID=313439 RepID=A0A380KY14_9STRE|nr:type II CAAX endopeptidase family protein [Streptococcus massiliensis]SUN76863.1 CAAX amino terminal protease family protein [Streptococcus massiliensis]
MKFILNVAKVIALIFLVVVCNVIPILFIQLDKFLPMVAKILLSIAYVILIGFVIYFLWKKYRSYQSQEVNKLKFGWKDFGIALLFFLAGRIIAIVGTYVNFLLTGHTTTANDAGIQSVGGGQTGIFPMFIILFMLLIGVSGPIIEELVFRGFIKIVLFSEKTSKILVAIVTSLIFGLVHITNFIELPLYFLMGVLLYMSYARRNNILDSIVVHMLNNLPMALLVGISLFFQ